MKHNIKLHIQKAAIVRAHEIIEETGAARIAQKKIDQKRLNALLETLDAAARTLDSLDMGIDARPDLMPD